MTFQKLTERALRDLDTDYSHQTPLKSDDYIINRYMRHPFYNYDVYSIGQALCVVRPIFIEGSCVLRLVDFLGPNEAVPSLGYFALELLKIHRAEYMDFYSYGIPLELLEEAGFIDREKVKDLIIPDHFEPFERKNINLQFVYKGKNNVRLFKGDGDQDRPNQVMDKK